MRQSQHSLSQIKDGTGCAGDEEPLQRDGPVPYSPNGYQSRAEECVRLANLTRDEMLSAELLKLRQSYLHIAERLGQTASTSERRQHQSEDRR
jgi:hypothetical protein